MKKVLFTLCLFLFPLLVSAKEYCTIVSGNGNNIGDEIKCGTESFYIVSSDKDKISLLAKYNLFIGDKIDYLPFEEVVEIAADIDVIEEGSYYCYEYAIEKGYDPYYAYPIVESTPENLTTLRIPGCRIYEHLEYENIRQDERAIGTKLDGSGKSILPLYGITYMNPEYRQDGFDTEYDENGNMILQENSSFKNYLDGYKKELENQGFEVKDVSFFTLEKTLNLLETISGESITLKLESLNNYDFEDNDHDKVMEDTFFMHFEEKYYLSMMDIKKYVGDHSWIHSSTYWLGSGFYSYDKPEQLNPFEFQDYYISNEGMLCAIGRGGTCDYLQYPVGNGLRPLVTIPKNSLKYNIRTKTDGNGTIEVINSAYAEEKISFKITSSKGYTLSKLIVTTDSGEKVEFEKGKDITNLNGIVTINNNLFTMPYDNVTIEAYWEIENPDTGSYIMCSIITLVILGIGNYFLKRKASDMI